MGKGARCPPADLSWVPGIHRVQRKNGLRSVPLNNHFNNRSPKLEKVLFLDPSYTLYVVVLFLASYLPYHFF